MKNLKLQNFLKLHLEANSIVLLTDQVCELISFNTHITLLKYKKYIEEVNQKAYFIHMNNLIQGNGDSEKYLNCLLLKFDNALIHFNKQDGLLLHERISIRDRCDNSISFDDLTIEVKQKISSFIFIQKSSLVSFISMLNLSENHLPFSLLQWKATKTDLVELSNALYEGGFISSENGQLTKKEFMNQFSALLNINIGPWEIKLNKARLRENSASFMNKLKIINSKYYTQ